MASSDGPPGGTIRAYNRVPITVPSVMRRRAPPRPASARSRSRPGSARRGVALVDSAITFETVLELEREADGGEWEDIDAGGVSAWARHPIAPAASPSPSANVTFLSGTKIRARGDPNVDRPMVFVAYPDELAADADDAQPQPRPPSTGPRRAYVGGRRLPAPQSRHPHHQKHPRRSKRQQTLYTRKDAVLLTEHFQRMLRDIPSAEDDTALGNYDQLKFIHTSIFNELLQQVSQHCAERGALLADVWFGIVSVYESKIESLMKRMAPLIVSPDDAKPAGDEGFEKDQMLEMIDSLRSQLSLFLEEQEKRDSEEAQRLQEHIDTEKKRQQPILQENEQLKHLFRELSGHLGEIRERDSHSSDREGLAAWTADVELVGTHVQSHNQRIAKATAAVNEYKDLVKAERKAQEDLETLLDKERDAKDNLTRQLTRERADREALEAKLAGLVRPSDDAFAQTPKLDAEGLPVIAPLPRDWHMVHPAQVASAKRMPRAEYHKLIDVILKAKVLSDERTLARRQLPLVFPDVVLSLFLNKHNGHRGNAESSIAQLLFSADHFVWSSAKARFFGRVCGVLLPFSRTQLVSIFRCLSVIVSGEAECLDTSPDGAVTSFPVARMAHVVFQQLAERSTVARMMLLTRMQRTCTVVSTDTPAPVAARAVGENAGDIFAVFPDSTQPGGFYADDPFSSHANLDCHAALEVYGEDPSAPPADVESYLAALFRAGSMYNSEGGLSATEFASVARFGNGSLAEDEIHRIFSEGTSAEEHLVGLDSFKVIAHRYNLIQPIPPIPGAATDPEGHFDNLEQVWIDAESSVDVALAALREGAAVTGIGTTDSESLALRSEQFTKLLTKRQDPQEAWISLLLLMNDVQIYVIRKAAAAAEHSSGV